MTAADDVALIEEEVEAARAAGLAVERTTDTDLPFAVAAAARLADQAQIDPKRYLGVLTREFLSAGGTLHPATRASAVTRRSSGLVVTAGEHEVRGEHVIVATGLPFMDRSLHFALVEPRRSYALAVSVEGDVPQSMSISAGSGPTRSLRTMADPTASDPGAGDWLLVGGEGHIVGRTGDTWTPYERLAEWASEHFAVRSIERRWSAQDYQSPDRLPYIGGVVTLPTGVLVATGFSKWGIAMGTAAGLLLADEVRGERTPDPFAAGRLGRGVTKVLHHNAGVAAHLVGDRVRALARGLPDDLADDEGVTGRRDHRSVAAACVDGRRTSVSAACTHLGGTLTWNPAEQTWDCPLHGSRFDATGTVVQGPATRNLDPVDDSR